MLIDAHCHLNSLSPRVKSKVINFFESNCARLIDSSIDLKSSLESIKLSRDNSFVYSSLGFHPFACESFSSEVIKKYEYLLQDNSKIVALGEIGLDYKAEASLINQEKIFRKWLELAIKNDRPVLIHCRLNQDNWYRSQESKDSRLLAVLDDYFLNYQNVIFHCFSYSFDFLSQIVAKGGFISFSLNVLRKNQIIIDSLKRCPLKNLLLETDSPYMRVKGKLSSSVDIESLYSYVAHQKGITVSHLKKIVSSNAKRVFKRLG